MRRPPTLPSDGMVTMNVLNIFLSDFALFTSLRTLPILNDLISVVDAPKSASVKKVRKTLISVKLTTTRSNMFQAFKK